MSSNTQSFIGVDGFRVVALQGEVINMHEESLPGVIRAHRESGQKTVVCITSKFGVSGVDCGVGINVSVGLWTVRADDLSVWRFSPFVFVKDLLTSLLLVLGDMGTFTFLLFEPITLVGL